MWPRRREINFPEEGLAFGDLVKAGFCAMVKQGKPKSEKSRRGRAGESRPQTAAASQGAGGGWKWPVVFAVVLVVIAAGATWWKMRGPAGARPGATTVAASGDGAIQPDGTDWPQNTGPEAGFAGAATCAECHKNIVETYNHIAMGRSLYRPTSSNIIEDYDEHNEFYHEASGVYYRMSRDGERFFQTSFQKDPDGRVIHENKVEVSYVVGSGNNSRSYIHREPDGKVYQLPVAWYTQEKRWAMNPGYDNADQINFSRRITYDCLFCHAAYPEVKPGADQANYGESSFFPEHLEAIDCERCHGPAQNHVNLARSGAAAEAVAQSIVNPGNLSNELQMEVCMQCHLETTSGNLPHSVHAVGKGIFGYRPGEPLEEYRYAFDHPAGTGHDDKFEIASQAYRLRKSACFIKSEGRMTCTTCHDPHRVPKDKISAAIQSCLDCHNPKDCTEKVELRLPVKDNCIQCHMPRRRTDDVVHVVMTDHYIQRRAPDADTLLAPKKEKMRDYRGEIVAYYPNEMAPDKRDLYMGLAYVANAADLELGIRFLDSAMARKNGPQFPAVYTSGVALKMLGRLEESRKRLEEAVQHRPDHPQAWMALGDLHEQMRNYDRSAECYRTAARLDPRLSRAQNGLGTSLLMAGDMEGAAKAFKTAITLDPFDDNAHLNLSGIFLQRGDYAGAIAEAQAALAVNPNRPAGWGHIARCALEQNRPADVLWPVLEAIHLDGKEMHNGEILALACKAVPSEAGLPLLDKLTTRSPFAAWVARASLAARDGDLSGARASLAAAGRETSRTAVLPLAAETALVTGLQDLALIWAGELVTAQPKSDQGTVLYASALRANKLDDQAAAVLQSALQRERSPRVLNALAWLRATSSHAGLRNGAQAAELLKEAMGAMGKANVYLLQTQAAVAAETGRIDEATAVAEQARRMALDAGLQGEVQRIEEQLAAYRAGEGYTSRY